MEDEVELLDLPYKCPICNKTSKNLLLHIRKKESCSSQIDPTLYDHWKMEQSKYSKRKLQSAYVKNGKHKDAQARYVKTGKHKEAVARYVKTGGHSEAQARYVDAGKHKLVQAKYEEKFRLYCKVCKYRKTSYSLRRQECNCPPADRGSFLQTKRHIQQKFRNKERVKYGVDNGKKRLEKFREMCFWCLYCLKHGRILNYTLDNVFNRFHLVEAEVEIAYYDDDGEFVEEYDDDETHSWLSDVDGSLLCVVITFQNVVLAPKSKWKNAIEEVNNNEAKTHLKEKLFSLIGKLQSYDNRNTRQIEIPDEYKVNKAKDDVDWRCPKPLIKEDEELLVDLLMDIVADEDVGEDLLELLKIDKFTETVETALLYTKGSTKAKEKESI